MLDDPLAPSIPLTHAEALMAAGETEAARSAIAEARDDVLARANHIDDEKYRRSFLERVAVHARTLALAKEWLD